MAETGKNKKQKQKHNNSSIIIKSMQNKTVTYNIHIDHYTFHAELCLCHYLTLEFKKNMTPNI